MPEHESLPTEVAGYKVIRRLGSGVMGEVYMGQKESGQAIFHAIKVVNPDRVRTMRYANAFKRPIDKLLLQYHQIDEQSPRPTYFVSDYLEVRPCSREVLSQTLSGDLLELFAECAEACAKAHEKNMIHGNIKPSNLLIRRAGGHKMMGILSDWALEYVLSKEYHLLPGTFDRVFPWMAPERIEALLAQEDEEARAKVVPASDVYSLTCVLVEALSGDRVFTGAGSVEEIKTLKREKKYLLLNVNSPVKQVEIGRLNEIIARNLSYEAGRRMQTMGEFAAGLRSCKAVRGELRAAS